jgi:hypothetical protein
VSARDERRSAILDIQVYLNVRRERGSRTAVPVSLDYDSGDAENFAGEDEAKVGNLAVFSPE